MFQKTARQPVISIESQNTRMATVRSVPRFSMIRKSTRPRLTQRSCRKVSADIAAGGKKQSNEDSEDAGFCGEPFADNGELLSSLSSLLFSMKLCGLYFHRQDRNQRRTEDPERNTAPIVPTFFSGLRVYATVALIFVWLNVIRLFSLFGKGDHFGAVLLIKIMVFAALSLTAFMYSAYYYANHTGKLYKILLTLPVTQDCVIGAKRVAVAVTAIMWISSIINLSIIAYIHFATDGELDFTAAPFVTYINVPLDKIIMARICGYLPFIFLFPGVLFSHAMSLLIVFVFWHQFNKLKKQFRRAVGKRGRFSGDLSAFRRRHLWTWIELGTSLVEIHTADADATQLSS